jgi:hypothetical protein
MKNASVYTVEEALVLLRYNPNLWFTMAGSSGMKFKPSHHEALQGTCVLCVTEDHQLVNIKQDAKLVIVDELSDMADEIDDAFNELARTGKDIAKEAKKRIQTIWEALNK